MARQAFREDLECAVLDSDKRDDSGYVPPSPAALRILRAGIESAKTGPLVSRESYAKYADDEDE
jgi:hypothetical protein